MYPDRRELAAEGCDPESDPEMRIVVDTYEGETSGQPVQAGRKQQTARSFGTGPSVVALINVHQMKEVKSYDNATNRSRRRKGAPGSS